MKQPHFKHITLVLAFCTLKGLSPSSFAEILWQPVGVTTSAKVVLPLSNTINQSGLVELGTSNPVTYVGGTTDFDSFVASTGHVNNNTDAWLSDTNFPKLVTFDLGGEVEVNGFVHWQAFAFSTMNEYELFADTDNNFENGSTSLGIFVTPFILSQAINVPGHAVSFPTVATQYVHMNITSFHGGVDLKAGEYAFSLYEEVPEPSSLLLLALGGLIAAHRRVFSPSPYRR